MLRKIMMACVAVTVIAAAAVPSRRFGARWAPRRRLAWWLARRRLASRMGRRAFLWRLLSGVLLLWRLRMLSHSARVHAVRPALASRLGVRISRRTRYEGANGISCLTASVPIPGAAARQAAAHPPRGLAHAALAVPAVVGNWIVQTVLRSEFE